MREIPILFSAPMMLANLAGVKDVTRRLLKNPEWYGCPTGDCPHQTQHECDQAMNDPAILRACRYGSPGDVLWARETWRPFWHPELYCCVQYASDSSYRKPEFTNEERGHRFADMCEQSGDNAEPWHPSIHMWREMARFTAPIVSVRIERLQEITEEDAIREGCNPVAAEHCPKGFPNDHARIQYAFLWDSINGEGSWEANPWVWRIEYRNPNKEYA